MAIAIQEMLSGRGYLNEMNQLPLLPTDDLRSINLTSVYAHGLIPPYEQQHTLAQESYRLLKEELITEEGIVASKDIRFRHFFLRDGAIVEDSIIDAFEQNPTYENFSLARTAVKANMSYWNSQLANGFLPHERLPIEGNENNENKEKGFYQESEDGKFYINKNSIDGQTLMLGVTARLWEYMLPEEHDEILPKADLLLNSLIDNMEQNGGWVSYFPDPKGLSSHGWMDSEYGAVDEEGKRLEGPIALPEVQGQMTAALQRWGDIHIKLGNNTRASELYKQKIDLTNKFNNEFLMDVEVNGEVVKYPYHAIHKGGTPVRLISSNGGLCLTASVNGKSIYEDRYVDGIIKVITSEEPNKQMYHPGAGISTFRSDQKLFGDGYHAWNTANDDTIGIIWPQNTGQIRKGLLKVRPNMITLYRAVSNTSRQAIERLGHFKEQFIIKKDGTWIGFREGQGATVESCRTQTWDVAEYFCLSNDPIVFSSRVTPNEKEVILYERILPLSA